MKMAGENINGMAKISVKYRSNNVSAKQSSANENWRKKRNIMAYQRLKRLKCNVKY
jgi:hypothetical protein